MVFKLFPSVSIVLSRHPPGGPTPRAPAVKDTNESEPSLLYKLLKEWEKVSEEGHYQT